MRKPCPNPKRPTLWQSRRMVTLYGSNETSSAPFIVHREFATFYSPVLKAAFESDFREGQTQIYRIDAEFADNTMRILSLWLYTQEIDVMNFDDPELKKKVSLVDDASLGSFSRRCMSLLQLWVLADRLLIRKLQNAVLDKLEDLLEGSSYLPQIAACDFVYENTAVDCPLRQWLVFQWSNNPTREAFASSVPIFPQEMVDDMMLYFFKMRQQRLNYTLQHPNLEKYKVLEEE